MSKKARKLLCIAFSALVGFSITAAIPTTSQAAKRKPGKVVRTMKYKTMKVKAKKGYVYTSTKLTKRGVHLTKYKNKVMTTKKAYLIKVPGKPAVWYDRVSSKNKKLNGYVYNNYLKVIKKSSTNGKTSTKTTNKVPVDPDANVPLKDLYSYGTNSKNNPDQKNGYDGNQTYYDSELFSKYPANLTDYNSIFVEVLNQERQARGIAPMSVDSTLSSIAEKRAKDTDSADKLDHYDSDGNIIAGKYLKAAGLDVSFAECLCYVNEAPARMAARESLRDYIYQDADSDWGHRDALLNPSYSHVGVGAVKTSDGGFIANAVVMY
ncbi:CAP domain-containing protein [Levilactobacillus brevis]|uniref:CAP domain-containing protein n=1 Tax=Levilactobacillus brevis TaxID=1580 RepID=UPI001CDAB01D|nr:CAP domain-containing protein [Levilactobacillus brevis]MCZ2119281.1 CAP domain-containing protein [Levilactobacillus brevis]MCZ2124769.1 CAP domain-containing protein [Levilactobacillus brevis]MCZ2209052.1 CAP domain-containing protein [Levilactobacillus brevis]MCZ2324553.1 CAP domain-containing protein [Levilactobacillus brevis]